jgi:hypothetical protein
MYKTLEEAAVAVDDMFNAALQNAGCTLCFPCLLYSLNLRSEISANR